MLIVDRSPRSDVGKI